jgi:hypothetical protein
VALEWESETVSITADEALAASPGELALVPRLSVLAVGLPVNMHVHLDSFFVLG